MAKAYSCDNCGRLIAGSDIRIVLAGYQVLQNEEKPITKGYGIGKPEEFCSLKCLSAWALNEQEMLDDYLALTKQPVSGGETMKEG
jgi:hypothetical protein